MANDAFFSNKKILITGASGFIGSHLSFRLSRLDAEIHVVSRNIHEKKEKNIQWWNGDLTDVKFVRRVIKTVKPNLIFNLASYVTGARDLDYVMPTFHNNLLSQINLITIASEVGCDRFITTGSMEEPHPIGPHVMPNSPYAAAKFSANTYARMFHALYQFPVVILRVFMVYGPNQKDTSKLIPYIILALLKGESPKLSSGQRKVDWIYVNDVVDGILTTAQIPDIEGLTIELGSGTLVPIKSVVHFLVNNINPEIKPIFGFLPDRPLEQEPIANIKATYDKIGWKPLTQLEDGLIKTIRWYRHSLFSFLTWSIFLSLLIFGQEAIL